MIICLNISGASQLNCKSSSLCLQTGLCSAYLILLVLAEGPHGPQVPAGAPAVREALDNHLHICQSLFLWRGFPHGGRSVGDPGTPVVLNNEHI